MTKRVMVLICGVLWLASGCASSGRVVSASPMHVTSKQYPTVAVSVTASEEKYAREAEHLAEALVIHLKRAQLFREVFLSHDANAKSSALLLQGNIGQVRRVSKTARILFGGLAGRSKIVITVQLTDARTRGSVGEFHVEGKSSGGTIFAGTTDQAAEKVVAEIVSLLRHQLTM
ncbi:MAG: DUF4410 domain-containing protein [Deltaproteobacteria bacterium]|nr:DUF4410 domain-containing protein [Deltaproteobacteria bacterium]